MLSLFRQPYKTSVVASPSANTTDGVASPDTTT